MVINSQIKIIGGLFAVFILLVALSLWTLPAPSFPEVRVFHPLIRCPQQLLNEDFQTPLDRDLTEQIQKAENTKFCSFLDREIFKPLIDDVNNLNFSVDGIEVAPGQFPDRPELLRVIDDCSRILKVPRPRVFVSNIPGVRLFTTNFRDPVIVIHSSVLSRFTSEVELRFLIGREMGHIRCSHVKWLMILRCIKHRLPDNITVIALLPFLKWAREAEMSADNAGLICCQDLKAAELSMVRSLLNVNEQSVGKINVDSYLNQGAQSEGSCFAEAMFMWRQVKKLEPFVPDRVNQMRRYKESQRYQHLWER
jgi:Zn-dependent protease with chaperone function